MILLLSLHNMSSKYVMANVEMPIEITPDNKAIPLHEYSVINIISIIDSVNNLKKKNVPDIITQSTELFEKQRLDNISSTDTIPSTNADLPHSGLFIYPEEIKTKTSLQKRNTSFKNRKFRQRSTSKYREPN